MKRGRILADDRVWNGAPGGQMNREVGNYAEDNSEAVRFEGDDVGLPESPIYSNFSKHLWRTHARHGLVQSPNRSRENTNGYRPTQDES
jgi:hypothetical protein